MKHVHSSQSELVNYWRQYLYCSDKGIQGKLNDWGKASNMRYDGFACSSYTTVIARYYAKDSMLAQPYPEGNRDVAPILFEATAPTILISEIYYSNTTARHKQEILHGFYNSGFTVLKRGSTPLGVWNSWCSQVNATIETCLAKRSWMGNAWSELAGLLNEASTLNNAGFKVYSHGPFKDKLLYEGLKTGPRKFYEWVVSKNLTESGHEGPRFEVSNAFKNFAMGSDS